ncbi:TonB family protein [Paracoccus benzoatiresistens]|uniref:TonB family protein n=1 Tax=Paracoccus benzoatiresistens TaxID=2997341 RepID=A0ABT4J0H3_9RHOB|nr:TonB family protein [Paracoccus sp. EF6]MCZ0960614.1 TonB family protein [Paracoccus sp. EF6]
MSGRAGRVIREGALWGGASALVLALHLGGALWIMRQAEAAAPPGLPEPVFVDLAPAEEVAEESVAPTEEPVDDAAEEPVEPEPQPEPEPEPEPAPEEVAEPLDLPPLPELEPLEDMAELFPPAPPELETPPEVALNSSARPQRRPEREPEPEPQRQAEPRRERPQPEPQRQAEPRRQEQPAQQQARRAPQGAGGSGATGPSPQQKASLMSQWGGQIRSCISRRASAPRGVREGGRVTLNLSVSRNGSIQGVGIQGSSGNPALDQAAVQAAQRAGRCPRAPAELTDASYGFQLPINLQVR